MYHHKREPRHDGWWSTLSGVLGSALLCAALLLGPSPALAGGGQHVRVVVDVSTLGAEEASFGDAILPSLRAAIEGAGYVLDDDVSADATVRIRVRYFNENDLDYQIEVDISAGDQLARLDTIACPQCFERDIAAKVDENHEMILVGLERMLAKASTRTTEPPTPSSEEPDPTAKPKPTSALGALGGAGIGVAVLGVGALVAGGVELGRGKIYDDGSTGAETDSTFVDHRPVGGALLGVGTVVLAAGVTMVIVDVVRAKRQRERAVVVPLLGPSIVGLGFSNRF